MRKLTVFNFITLNGFYKGPEGEINWHAHGEEENSYSEDSLKARNILLFGRVTYEMMASFWPTPQAAEFFPIVAEGMNTAKKLVFSTSLKKIHWNNTRIVSGDIVNEVRRLKSTPGNNLSILGSGSIVTQLTEAGLIDEYEIMIDPVAIVKGTPIFEGLIRPLKLKLKNTRVFKSGVVLLCYDCER